MNLEQLNNTYKHKWINEYGNHTNSHLEKMWSDIFQTLDDTANRNAIRRMKINDISEDRKVPRSVIFSSTMGSGKSTALQHYLLNSDTFTRGPYKALIIIEQIDACAEYEKILKEKGAVAIHSKNNRNLKDCLSARILIITHSRLITLLTSGISDTIFDMYDLVAIDEQINTYQHVSFTQKELEVDILPVLNTYNVIPKEEETFFDFVIFGMEELEDSFKKQNGRWIHDMYTKEKIRFLDHHKLANKIEEFLFNANNVKQLESERHYKVLENTLSRLRILSKQGRMKVSYFQKDKGTTTFNVVIDFLPIHISKVIFDGTAVINDTYQLLNEHIGEGTAEIKSYNKLRTFTNATIKYYNIATGKSKLTVSTSPITNKKKYKKELEDVEASLKELINGVQDMYGTEENVLFIVHKNNLEMLQELTVRHTKWEIIYWGKHVGTNDWSSYSKVIVYGLNYLPENVYTAIFYSTMSSRTNIKIAPIDNMKAGLLTSDILQGIFRGQLRKVVGQGGNCLPGTEVILSLPKNHLEDAILHRMKSIIPDATYEKINWVARVDSHSINTKKMEELLHYLSTQQHNDYLLPKEVNKEVPFPIRDLLDRGSNCTKNRITLNKHNWYYNDATLDDKDTYNLNGNTKKLFKYSVRDDSREVIDF